MRGIIINKQKLNIFLSTLNFVLCFVGFKLVTSVFLPASSDIEGISRSVTLPYRALTLVLSCIVCFFNIKQYRRRFPIGLTVFLFFWGILILRIIYDILIRSDIKLHDTSQVWIYVFGICLPSIFSVIKSYKYIDVNKSFYWILGLTALTLVFTLFSNQVLLMGSVAGNVRQGGNAAISTISFGHFGATTIILGLYTIIHRNVNWFYKSLLILMILLGAFCMLRAGSRGPILALAVVIFFWLFSLAKNISRSILTLVLTIVVTLIFVDQILVLVGNISPIMEDRLRLSIYEGSTGGRDPYYANAVRYFLESPIWGEQFVIIFPNGTHDYAHNVFLDALMGLGVIGGSALVFFFGVAFKKSYSLINNRHPDFWISLLLIQQIISNMVSGAFYFNPLLSVLLTFIFLKYSSDSDS